MDHETVEVCVGDRKANIDVLIAPLIKALWERGIRTVNSCQENQPGRVWIEFFSPEDASEFFNIAAGEFDYDFDSIYNRIRQEWCPTEGEEPDWWDYTLHPWDGSVVVQTDEEANTIEETPGGPIDFQFTVSVRFPEYDLKEIMEKMNDNSSQQNSS